MQSTGAEFPTSTIQMSGRDYLLSLVARCTAITYGGDPVVVRCDREVGHSGSHATSRELQHGR